MERKKLRIKGYISLLKDPNLNCRWRAAEARGDEGDKTAVEPLIEALKSEDKGLRTGAAWALGKLQDSRAVGPILQLLPGKKDRSENSCLGPRQYCRRTCNTSLDKGTFR